MSSFTPTALRGQRVSVPVVSPPRRKPRTARQTDAPTPETRYTLPTPMAREEGPADARVLVLPFLSLPLWKGGAK